MARQVSIIKLSGSLGGLNFYKSADGHLARTKPGVTKERMRSDPKLVRARENGWEFGIAARAGKVMRHTFRTVAAEVCDRLVSSRMQTCMLHVLRTDPIGKRGERSVSSGDLSLLKGFNFNIHSNFDTVFHGKYQSALDIQSGSASLNIPAFSPRKLLEHPKSATHFQISMATAQVDFSTGSSAVASSETEIKVLDEACSDILLNAALPPGASSQFLMVKVTFYRFEGGAMVRLNNMKYAAATILEVRHIPTKPPGLIVTNSRPGNPEMLLQIGNRVAPPIASQANINHQGSAVGHWWRKKDSS